LDAVNPFQKRRKNNRFVKHVERQDAVLLAPFANCGCIRRPSRYWAMAGRISMTNDRDWDAIR
jgi:hypothetical protein